MQVVLLPLLLVKSLTILQEPTQRKLGNLVATP